MKLTELRDLTRAVQCRRPDTATYGLGWETIAAFNSDYIAERYMRDCQRGAKEYQYRVVTIET